MAYTPDYDDLDLGDEVRGEAVQTVGLPHGAAEDGSGGPSEGDAVAWDDTNDQIVAADDTTGPAIGVLYTYQYFGDSSRDGPYIRTDRNATVAVGGKLKVPVVDSTVTVGPLTTGTGGSPGEFEQGSDGDNVIALCDAVEQGSTGNYYVEALIN